MRKRHKRPQEPDAKVRVRRARQNWKTRISSSMPSRPRARSGTSSRPEEPVRGPEDYGGRAGWRTRGPAQSPSQTPAAARHCPWPADRPARTSTSRRAAGRRTPRKRTGSSGATPESGAVVTLALVSVAGGTLLLAARTAPHSDDLSQRTRRRFAAAASHTGAAASTRWTCVRGRSPGVSRRGVGDVRVIGVPAAVVDEAWRLPQPSPQRRSTWISTRPSSGTVPMPKKPRPGAAAPNEKDACDRR